MTNLYGKAWATMLLLLVIAESVFLGMDLNQKDWRGAIVDAILLAFWVFTVVWWHYMSLREVKHDLEFDRDLANIKQKGDEILKDIMEKVDHENRIQKALHDATKETGDRPPKPSEYKKIEARFHELTGDHYLRLTPVKGDKRPQAEVSSEPFETKPATKKAPVKKPVVKKAPAKKTTVTKKGK